MCNTNYSESGKPCGITRCDDFNATRAALVAAQLRCGDLEQERDALLKVREAADALCKEAETFANERVWNACEVYKESRNGRV